MNRKAIRKVLKTKHKQLCDSITDEHVRNLVKKNTFITGGAIVSLLNNERVHDFDCYFTDKETTLAVANYYAKEFEKNENWDVIVVESNVNTDRIKIIVPSKGVASSKCTTVMAEAESASVEEEAAIKYAVGKLKGTEEVEEEIKNYQPIFLSSNAITLSNQMQLIIRFYGKPEEVHKNYDFVHCTNYWVANTDILVLKADALESIVTKHLRYEGSLYPLCSIIRTRKFIQRGWYINAGQYLKMCFQLSELDLTDLDVLEEQLIGVDAAYFGEIIDYCRKRQETDKNFKLDSIYLVEIVDKIF